MKRLNKSIQFILILLIFALFFYGCGPEHSTPELSALRTGIPSATQENTISPLVPFISPSLSETATSISTPSIIDTILQHGHYQYGDCGDEIVMIQEMLIELGFDPGDADGIYGALFSKAIRNFQLYVGLSADGFAGEKTISALVERYINATTIFSQSKKPLEGHIVGIDPGHQRYNNGDLEPFMPGSQKLKQKVSAGTYGRYTGVPEYVVNLQVGLKLRRKLEALGADVILTRQTHDVDMSNAQRARLMNEAGVFQPADAALDD